MVSAAQCQFPGVTEELPNDCWSPGIPPLPHQDDVIAIGSSDFAKEKYLIAVWCKRKLQCTFEEYLPKLDVTPLWFDAKTGTALFSIICNSINYYKYTGRDFAITGGSGGGGQRYINGNKKLPVQMFVPAIVDRSPSLHVKDGCVVKSHFFYLLPSLKCAF